MRRAIGSKREASTSSSPPTRAPPKAYRAPCAAASCWRATATPLPFSSCGALCVAGWLSARALEGTADRGLPALVGEFPATQRVLLNLPSGSLGVHAPQDLRAARRRLRPPRH